ncbi:hypothetical protein [Pontibacter rugosus]|uniref:Uncharacterized protein n=1 Tax=Pontibacter rugosus TaxID=1745966 RepID=A0ABW3SNL6_9BACT
MAQSMGSTYTTMAVAKAKAAVTGAALPETRILAHQRAITAATALWAAVAMVVAVAASAAIALHKTLTGEKLS